MTIGKRVEVYVGASAIFAAAAIAFSTYAARSSSRLNDLSRLSTAGLRQSAQLSRQVANILGARTESAAVSNSAFEREGAQTGELCRGLVRMASEGGGRPNIEQVCLDVSSLVSLRTDLAGAMAAGDAARGAEINSKMRASAARILEALESFEAAESQEAVAAAEKGQKLQRTAAVDGLFGLVLCGLTAFGGTIVFRRLVRDVRIMQSQLAACSNEILSAAKQMETASQQLANQSTQQAASNQEASAAATELAATTQRSLESARESARLASEAEGIGYGLMEAVDAMTQAMANIEGATGDTSRVLKVIEEVAFQTNILALNANVEAARAGQAGAGFAVVADEVRNLAQRSARAAQDTTTILDRSLGSVRDGKLGLETVSDYWKRNFTIQEKLKQFAEQVSNASEEQTRGITQIAQSSESMCRVTEAIAAQAEEGAAATSELIAQSQNLKEIVGSIANLLGESAATTG